MDESLAFNESCADIPSFMFIGTTGIANAWLGPIRIDTVVVKGLIN